MFTKNLIHGKHMDPLGVEYCLHSLVTPNVSFVGWILKVVAFDVMPYFPDNFGA